MKAFNFGYRIFKFVISGAGATLTNFTVLYLLTEYGHVYYLYSAMVAFILAFMVSFILQKYWTFNAGNQRDPARQLGLFLGVALFNLACNTLFLYVLVDIFHVWYLGAAVAVSVLIAILSFFIYRYIIFDRTEESLAKPAI